MTYEIKKIVTRGISNLSDGDVKNSLMSEMVNGKNIQLIAPKFSNSGLGEMIIWLEHA